MLSCLALSKSYFND